MQRLEVSGAVRPLYGSLGVRGLITSHTVRGLLELWITAQLLQGNAPCCESLQKKKRTNRSRRKPAEFSLYL